MQSQARLQALPGHIWMVRSPAEHRCSFMREQVCMHASWRWNRHHQSTAFVSRVSASIEVLFLGYKETRDGVRRLTHPQCRGHLRGILPDSVRASHPGRPPLARPGPHRLPATYTVLLVFQQNLICLIQTLYLPWPLTDTDTVMWSLTTFLQQL